MSTALVIGSRDDPHVAAVAQGLDSVFVVDAPSLQQLDYRVDLPTFVLETTGGQIDLALGCRGWVRRLAPVDWEVGTVVGSVDAASKAAWLSLLAAILRHPRVAWLSGFDDMNRAENKLTQGLMAHAASVAMPQTFVTNDAAAIAGSGSSFVAKALGPAHFRTGDGWRTVFTEAFAPLAVEDSALLSGPPFIVQRQLAPRRHLRVVTVRERTWAFELDARDLPIDWREHRDAHRSWIPTNRPDVEKQACVLARSFDLGYTSQDWCECDDGVFFLDLNPAGQWLFLPSPGARQITEAITAWLGG